jgi:hypothetical protein
VAQTTAAVKRSALGRFRRYVCHGLRLEGYLERPGDGRQQPRVPARDLLWSLLAGQLLRESSHHAVEALVRSPARRALGIARDFGDDTLSYFTERLAAEPMRAALAGVVRLAKRNKAFERAHRIGLALDGTGAAAGMAHGCALCHPIVGASGATGRHLHHLSLISVVGAGLSLPFDVEPYGPGDCELYASERLLERALGQLGRRFADYVVVDGLYAQAPFLHRVGGHGLRVVARLKDNLPTLMNAARQRFDGTPPHQTFKLGVNQVELWDADDFDPWETLRWDTVRVLRYRQIRPNGTVCEAYWLTDWSTTRVGPLALYGMAKSRWEIENQGFNEAKNQHALEHIHHHHPASLLISWLLVMFALTLERLFRLRYLRRGNHRPPAAIDLVRRFRLDLATAVSPDSS